MKAILFISLLSLCSPLISMQLEQSQEKKLNIQSSLLRGDGAVLHLRYESQKRNLLFINIYSTNYRAPDCYSFNLNLMRNHLTEIEVLGLVPIQKEALAVCIAKSYSPRDTLLFVRQIDSLASFFYKDLLLGSFGNLFKVERVKLRETDSKQFRLIALVKCTKEKLAQVEYIISSASLATLHGPIFKKYYQRIVPQLSPENKPAEPSAIDKVD